MKLPRSLLVVAALVVSGHARADDPPSGTLVLLSGAEIFAPEGFDSNDQALVVLDGTLPNSCYRLAQQEVVRDADGVTFHVRQYARRFPGVCLDFVVPYTKEVELGVLPQGKFTVDMVGSTAQPLDVATATNAGPDDHLYAPIDSVHVEVDAAHHSYVGVIKGRFTNTCLAQDEVRLIDSGRTLEVLPIAKMQQTRAACQATEDAFTWTVALPSSMTPGHHLLHVRSLNGKSANAVFTVASPTR